MHQIEIQDQGSYECQVSSQPKISRNIDLIVLQPEVSILGDIDIHVKEGSEVELKCIITNTPRDVPFVTWLFNDQVGPLYLFCIKVAVLNCMYLKLKQI